MRVRLGEGWRTIGSRRVGMGRWAQRIQDVIVMEAKIFGLIVTKCGVSAGIICEGLSSIDEIQDMATAIQHGQVTAGGGVLDGAVLAHKLSRPRYPVAV